MGDLMDKWRKTAVGPFLLSALANKSAGNTRWKKNESWGKLDVILICGCVKSTGFLSLSNMHQ